MDMAALAEKTYSLAPGTLAAYLKDKTAYAVPITSGQGEITGFAQAAASIATHLGAKAKVSKTPNIEGIHEAIKAGAEIILTADDNRFIAYDTKTNKIAENDEATARIYVTALEEFKIKDKNVLLIGYGIIGKTAEKILKQKDFKVEVYDKKYTEPLTPETISSYRLIYDATNEGNWLTKEMLHENAKISAPGIPLSLTPEAEKKYKTSLIHDNLELGTASMLAALVAR
jgi:pyrrolysine biosynthesis protein PylD